MISAEIHCELCVVYGRNVMSEWTMRHWLRMFKDAQVKKCSGWRVNGWQAICSEWWSCSKCWPNNLWERVIHDFRTLGEFPALFSTSFITVRRKFCARGVPKMLTGAHKLQRMASALTFFEWCHKDGNEIFSHIMIITGNKTWASFVNVETKEQSKQWMHTHSHNKTSRKI
jgi:hypothetical protein